MVKEIKFKKEINIQVLKLPEYFLLIFGSINIVGIVFNMIRYQGTFKDFIFLIIPSVLFLFAMYGSASLLRTIVIKDIIEE